MRRLLTLMLIPSIALGQVRTDVEPDLDPRGDEADTNIQGDLNTSNSNNGNVNKTYNGAGSGRSMPVSSAISPSLMSSGTQSCLRSVTGGLQLVGVGVSSGRYVQDPLCNLRMFALTLSGMGMTVASISILCQDSSVWRAMLMSATPCPITRGGKLLVGKRALLEIKSNPKLWIPDYKDNEEFYNALLAGGSEDDQQDTGESISARYRSTKRGE